MRLPLLLLLLASCAPKGPSTPTYAKGAYRPAPARAQAFSPTEDAPHTFEPGRPSPAQPGPRYAPVPHTPKTRSEDTIWAIHPPQDEPDGGLMFMGVPLPPVEDAELRDKLPTRLCAGQLSAMLDRTSIKNWALRLPEKLRRCIAASLYYQCAATAEENNRHLAWPKWSRVKDAAKRFMDSACTTDMLSSDDLTTVEREVKAAWNKVAGGQ